jgi:hypothetical protein
MVSNNNQGTDDAPGDAPELGLAKPQSIVNAHETYDEESPLLSRPDSAEPTKKALEGVATIVAVLLLGIMAAFEDCMFTFG